jgi:hypothetical protein
MFVIQLGPIRILQLTIQLCNDTATWCTKYHSKFNVTRSVTYWPITFTLSSPTSLGKPVQNGPNWNGTLNSMERSTFWEINNSVVHQLIPRLYTINLQPDQYPLDLLCSSRDYWEREAGQTDRQTDRHCVGTLHTVCKHWVIEFFIPELLSVELAKSLLYNRPLCNVKYRNNKYSLMYNSVLETVCHSCGNYMVRSIRWRWRVIWSYSGRNNQRSRKVYYSDQ